MAELYIYIWENKKKGACVKPACLYGLGTIAVSGKQQRLQNWVGPIAGAKRADQREMDDLKEGAVQRNLSWEEW